MLSAILIVIAVVAIFIGISEYKRAVRANKAKRDFIAGMEHVKESLKELSDSIDEHLDDSDGEEDSIFKQLNVQQLDGFVIGDDVVVTNEFSPVSGEVGKIVNFVSLDGVNGAGVDFGDDLGITHDLEGAISTQSGRYVRLESLGLYIKEKPEKTTAKKSVKKTAKKVAKKKTSKKSK